MKHHSRYHTKIKQNTHVSDTNMEKYVVGLNTTLFVISPDPPNLISWVNFGLFAAWISGYRPTLYFTLSACIKYRIELGAARQSNVNLF